MNSIYEGVSALLGLGLEPKQLTFAQISLRGIIILFTTLVFVRLGHKRSLARKTAFDAIFLVIVAAMLARAINGSSPFFATIGAGFVVVLVHRAIGWLACRWHFFGALIKGGPQIVIQDGQLMRDSMKQNSLSENDLLEDLRLSARLEDPAQIQLARIERSGDVSFIKKVEK